MRVYRLLCRAENHRLKTTSEIVDSKSASLQNSDAGMLMAYPPVEKTVIEAALYLASSSRESFSQVPGDEGGGRW